MTEPEDWASKLRHHGDVEVGEGLVDLAVNVRLPQPPQWLAEILVASIATLGSYPDPTAARAALAERHGVPAEMVLPTAGGAEGFTLIARALAGRRPVVLHPQFTEPDLALRAADETPRWVELRREDGFRLDPASVPDCGLVMIGNPTNPTGVLHPREQIERLRRPGRVVVVDEAFMDAVPGEPETMIGPEMAGVLVLRSLTKTWGIAGLRAGYLVGDPELIEQLATQQTHWSVSTPALEVMRAVSTPRAVREAEAGAELICAQRDYLVAKLIEVGIGIEGDPQTPFVTFEGPPGLREGLRLEGFAVRRADTFPGLGEHWVRVAVRDRRTTDALVAAIARVMGRADAG